MQLIGTPDEADLGFVNENAKRYISQLPRHARQSFPEKFPHVHPAAIDLVENMLTFDPRQRITGKLILTIILISFTTCIQVPFDLVEKMHHTLMHVSSISF